MSTAKRNTYDPKAWRSTFIGTERYKLARAEAQIKANEYGFDYGIEANDLFQSFRVFMLPSKQHRRGHELHCEVAHCERLECCKPGHGPC